MIEKSPPSAEAAGADDPLDVLRAFERLEIGPARLEPNRLTVPYRVVSDGNAETTELNYRYEEDVFDPGSVEAVNLATMIAAQVALNYGLFCDQLVVHGPLDTTDRRFLRDMAANTAREIYVNKFLKPNPFIVGDAANLPAVRRESYLRARLVFPDDLDTPVVPDGPAPVDWGGDRRRCAVLSSGGKDSLLSHGLLDEIGCEVHPVFINESGRHWYTALNAYRHFSVNVPHTTRVWTDSDRLFTWMLRKLPFVRPDFAQIRADDYPVRLWTVAVFLFGALPLMRKRGIGRLVIGDEFDTTRRLKYHGIPHYDGLYDQSRNFDNTLTRYFMRKRWGVAQFSLLRPLSEFMIQQMLAVRYPALFSHQVSCHAAHVDEGRVYPCGRCEKCRRIVAMLVASDQDPASCGYRAEQVESCLRSLAHQTLHQESECAEHMAYLLDRKGVLSGAGQGCEHLEVTRLRFDPSRAPCEWIPGDLRARLLPIFLEHTGGAVRRQGRHWVDFDPATASEFRAPYPFEHPPGEPSPKGSSPEGSKRFLLGRWTWPEAKRRFRRVDVALLPVGAIEQHGPHLPLDTDSFDARYLAHEVAQRCAAPQPVVFPCIQYGVSYHHEDFPGTISLSPDTLAQLVYEVGMGAARNGIRKLIIVNGHGGNSPALHFAAQKINRDAHIFTAVDTGESSDADIDAIARTRNDVHAGEIETSTALANRPELVRMDLAIRHVPRFSSRYLDFSSRHGVGWYARVERLSPKGVLGDATCATLEKGQRMWAVMIRNLVEFVEDVKRMSLDEVYQKRY